MNLINRISFLLGELEDIEERVIPETNKQIEKIVSEFNKRGILKLVKVRSRYPYAEKYIHSGLRCSSYDNNAIGKAHLRSVLIVLKYFGYEKKNSGIKYDEFVKSKDEFVDVYYRDLKKTEIDNLGFFYR